MPVRGNIFKEQLISTPKRSYFDMSFDNTFTCNMGKIVPTICKELLPRDYIKMKSSAFMRFMPMVAPSMGKVNLFAYHFIVRNRDIWTEWDKFITNEDQKKTWQQNQNFIPPEMPYIDINQALSKIFAYGGASPSDSNIYNHYPNLYWLIGCRVHNSDSSYNNLLFISRQCPNLNDMKVSGEYDNVQIFGFIPNRGDFFEGLDKPIHLTGNPVTPSKYYNPFGAGSLMDFLGVNIDGAFKDNNSDFLDPVWLDSCGNQFSWDSVKPITEYKSDIFDPSFIGTQGFVVDTGINFENIRLVDKVTEEWFNSHAIVVFASIENTNVGYSWLGWNGDGSSTTSADVPNINYTFGDLAAQSDDFDFKISALPLRAYRFVYDEYFRDQNYIEVNPNTDFSRSGNDLDVINRSVDEIWHYLTFEAKCFEHDPYTTALPGPQKGEPVRFINDAHLKIGDSIIVDSGTQYNHTLLTNDGRAFAAQSSTTGSSFTAPSIEVDLSAATIENFRWANAMQKYLERKARTGGRYYEYLLGIWDSKVEDAKLNRPIYLGGDRTPVQIGEITQTSSTNVQTGQPLGDLAGRGVAVGRDNKIRFTCPDYGFLIEVCVCVPRTAYGQGIDQKFKRFNYMDYPLPDFAQLGEEAVKKGELYATLRKSIDESAFGWQSRYWYWKYNRDEVHSSMLTDMKHWNFARLFDSEPYAGKDFLEVNPSYRQFAVTDDSFDHCVVTMWHDITINRALPEFGTPIL